MSLAWLRLQQSRAYELASPGRPGSPSIGLEGAAAASARRYTMFLEGPVSHRAGVAKISSGDVVEDAAT